MACLAMYSHSSRSVELELCSSDAYFGIFFVLTQIVFLVQLFLGIRGGLASGPATDNKSSDAQVPYIKWCTSRV